MRDLASIVTVDKVYPMYQKDKIACVSFIENGYEAIVPKDDAVPGNKLCFIQEGAILPEIEAWEFLRKRCYNESVKGFVIKPMTMGKKDYNGEEGERVKSWGLAVSLNELPVATSTEAGTDLTEALGIRKYEPEEDASPKKGESKKAYPKWVKFCLGHKLTRWIGKIWQKNHQNISGNFPSNLISKSDETTIQNMKWAVEKFKDSEIEITAKMEGQSFTVIPVIKECGFIVKKKKLVWAYPCTRNNALVHEDKSIFWDMMRKYDIINKMKDLYNRSGSVYILQGEQVGPGIQNNIYNFKENHWYLYEAKSAKTLQQFNYKQQVAIADILGLRVVPLLKVGKMSEIMPTIEDAVKLAETASWEPDENDKIHSFLADSTKGELWKDYLQHEGIVVRTSDCDKDANIGCSFKVKNMAYQEKGLQNIAKLCKAIKE